MFNRFWFLGIALVLALAGAQPAYAAPSVAHAILFYDPTCPHCHVMLETVLPPLQAQYGDQLQIALIDVSAPAGQTLYQNAVVALSIPPERCCSPCSARSASLPGIPIVSSRRRSPAGAPLPSPCSPSPA